MTRDHQSPRADRHSYALRAPSLAAPAIWAGTVLLALAAVAAPVMTLGVVAALGVTVGLAVTLRRVPASPRTLRVRPLGLEVTVASVTEE